MDSSTIAFRLALPYVIFSAAPQLAALHQTQTRILHPDAAHDAPFCFRCGSLLVHHRTTLAHNKRTRRTHRRSCRICNASADTPYSTSTHPPTRRHGVTTAPLATELASQTASATPSAPLDPVSNPAKSRPKEKSVLQHLLARNREREEIERRKQKQNNAELRGLSAFLTDL